MVLIHYTPEPITTEYIVGMAPNPEQSRRQKRNKFQPTKPYTQERLQQAIRVFGKRKLVATRKQPYAIREFAASYNLRKRDASQLREIDMDIPDDDDNDDNYEPSTPRAQRRRATQSQPSIPDEPPASCIVRLSFSSVRGKSLLLQLKHADIFRDFVDSDDDEMVDALPSTKNDTKYTAQEDVSMEDSEGVERVIVTAFAHPIDCELGNNCGSPCDFCTDFTFGMFGLGIRTVSVIDHVTWFEELYGGHRDDGQEPTRMCNVCALTRLHIMNCGGHRITAIPNYDPYTFNIQAAFNSLGGHRLRGRRHQINEWCSFCINPAFFRCSTTQIIDIFANDIEDPSSPEAQGCGLRLCQSCKDLMDEHRNEFDRVIAAIPGATEKRADAEFFVDGSDLNRYFSE